MFSNLIKVLTRKHLLCATNCMVVYGVEQAYLNRTPCTKVPKQFRDADFISYKK